MRGGKPDERPHMLPKAKPAITGAGKSAGAKKALRPPPMGRSAKAGRGGAGAGGVKRALSMPRAPGPISTGGEPRLAAAMAMALQAPHVDDVAADSLTHPFHSYPARMHPATARSLVGFVMDDAGPDALLVDPFCGAGTTLVEARALGVHALGIDLNPLAVLIARAKTWTTAPRVRSQLGAEAQRLVREAIAAGKEARRATHDPTPLRGPAGFDPNARNKRLAKWFAPHVRRELEDLASRIDHLAERDEEIAVVLLASLSAVLYKVSSRTSDTDPTWIARTVGRGFPTRLFAQRVDLLSEGLDDLRKTSGARPDIVEADARTMTKLVKPGTAWAVVTSPPYAGTYDYAEHQRLRFDFLGLRHREMDLGEIGSRRSYVGDPHKARDKWREDLGVILDGIGTILAPGRPACLVIGDSLAGDRAAYALDDINDMVGDKLEVAAWASQQRPMLGGAERNAFGTRPKAEHIVLLKKK